MNLNNLIERSYPLLEIDGNEVQKTLYFDIGKTIIIPGQFYMLNYNGCQKPFSVSHYEDRIVGFTIQDRGECSKKMIFANRGSYFGLIGPLGNGFNIKNAKKSLLIGAGIGSAPIAFLLSKLYKTDIDVVALFGGRTLQHIEYLNHFKNSSNIKIKFYTDDGSYGEKGFVIKDLKGELDNNFDSCFICGPEKMMGLTIDIVKNNISDIQISMERYMKCGLGLCGSCVIDEVGVRTCEDGPVFSYRDQISNTKEFANWHRDSSGLVVTS